MQGWILPGDDRVPRWQPNAPVFMIRSLTSGAAALAFSLAAVPGLASAQGAATAAPASGFQVAPSTRATATVEFTAVVPANTPAANRPAPKRIVVDYGQPHLRGRDIVPLITPKDTPWRLGANAATSLVSDLELTIGGKPVPKGSYTLWLKRTGEAAELIVNRTTGPSAGTYAAAQDLVRVPLRVRKVGHSVEALQIALVPTPETNRGVLRILWGNLEMEADWEARP